MDTAVWLNPMTWLVIAVMGLLIGGINALLQFQSNEEFRLKSALRDGILASTFTAMTWALIPETMESLMNSVKTVDVIQTRPRGVSDFDLQIGPASF